MNFLTLRYFAWLTPHAKPGRVMVPGKRLSIPSNLLLNPWASPHGRECLFGFESTQHRARGQGYTRQATLAIVASWMPVAQPQKPFPQLTFVNFHFWLLDQIRCSEFISLH